MRTSALAASAVLATGLLGLGGTAFADSGSTAPATDTGDDSASDTTRVEPTATQAAADTNRSVINLSVPVAADLHEGVANDLSAQDVARDAVHVGRSDDRSTNTTGNDGQAQTDGQNTIGDKGESNNTTGAVAEANGTDAVARAGSVNVGGAVDQLVATATATVGGAAQINGGNVTAN